MDQNMENLAQQIALQENIQDYRLEIQSTSSKGDGYLGMIRFAKIIGSNKILDIVFKCRHANKEFLPVLIRNIYLNEIRFYEEIVPAFITFQEEYNVLEPFNNTAKFYGSIKETFKEILALENLKACNYTMWGRKQLMDEEHLKHALKTFAKFHSISFAMQELNPDLYRKLSANLKDDIFKQVFVDMCFYSQLTKTAREIKQIFNEDKDKVMYYNTLENFAANMEEIMEDAFTFSDCNVILQGDCWCTNALYKYNNNQSLIDMKLVDFQMVRLGSPVLDISYFLYAAAPKCQLDRLEYFIEFYHDELRRHLEKFELSADKLYSLETLKEHWQKVGIFGLGLGIGVKKSMLVDSQNAPDISEGASEFLEKMVMTPETKAVYDQQIRDLVQHFVERKLIKIIN